MAVYNSQPVKAKIPENMCVIHLGALCILFRGGSLILKEPEIGFPTLNLVQVVYES